MQKTIREKKRYSFRKRWNKEWPFHLMLLPAIILVFIFKYIPMAGLSIAFENYSPLFGMFDQEWVGLENFIYVFSLPNFGKVIYNTLFIALMKIVAGIVIPVIFALLLNEMQNIHGKKLAQTIIYLPHFMSWVVTASVFQLILSPATAGLVNQVLISLGIVDEGIYFLGSSQWWKSAYYVINIWHDTGWGTIIFMATLTSIDPGIYEAASIDGAGRWKKMWYVTLPALANTIITVLILNLAKIMNLFESVFVLQNDAVMDVSQVLQTYVYYQTFNSGGIPDYGYTTAIGLFRSLVGMALMLICNYASKKVRGRGIV